MDSKEKLIGRWISSGIIKGKKAIGAFRKVPREIFIGEDYLNEAYGDYPLPIGEGQTISQPTTVMLMTEALELEKGMKVLEVGAGSGYQAAIISHVIGKSGKVISAEIVPGLAAIARKNIAKLGIGNVEVLQHDGSSGYEKEAPYDRIIVTAACPAIPKPLASQLKEGGIIIAPVGNLLEQSMIRARKINGQLKEENLGYFAFVPLKGKHGHS